MKQIFQIYLFFCSVAVATADDSFNSVIKPFLETYCFKCHGEKIQKGDHRYDTLKDDFNNHNSLVVWRDILDQIQLEEMPPKKPFPTSDERKKITEWISAKIKQTNDQQLVSKTGTIMRRLSHTEYGNTLKDLFKIDVPNFDFTRGITPDNISHGFDTEAKQLTMSPSLYINYLEIADRFIEKTVPFAKPEAKTLVYSPDKLSKHRDTIKVAKTKTSPPYLEFVGREPGSGRSFVEENGASSCDAYYKVKITLEAINRDKNWEDMDAPKPGTPWKFKVIAASEKYGSLKQLNTSDYDITTLIVLDTKKTFEFEAFVKKDHRIVFWWENGGRGIPKFINNLGKEMNINGDEYVDKIGRDFAYLKFYNGPKIRLHELEIQGPFFKTWPPAPVTELYGQTPPEKPTFEFAKKQLTLFAAKAWRRPVTATELEPIFNLVHSSIEEEGYSAISKGIKAIICSPTFLYHHQNLGKLDDFALASRLSFFLWGTAPDVELLRLAYQKQLSKPEVYNAQINRLLADPKLNNMVSSFTTQWLNLKKAEEMPPDEVKFKNYYQLNINKDMVTESQEFIKLLINKNLSIYNCLDSDFVVINKNLAEFYGLEKVQGNHFRQVKLPPDSPRGGLLTQASVLTATSNGVETSPIVRGMWVLENILGTPPPPPPADVEPLEPDIRGTSSIKDRLKAHRDKESCNECHRKIDYLGLTLEAFDPVGLERNFYDSKKKIKIDTTSETPTGKTINNTEELKQFLMERKKLFARALTEKLLAYSTGRKMSLIEQGEIDKIVESLDKENGFKDLLVKILNNPIFLNR